jgi:hypothetical protein
MGYPMLAAAFSVQWKMRKLASVWFLFLSGEFLSTCLSAGNDVIVPTFKRTLSAPAATTHSIQGIPEFLEATEMRYRAMIGSHGRELGVVFVHM